MISCQTHQRLWCAANLHHAAEIVALALWQHALSFCLCLQVFKGVKNGVQPVAVKVLNKTDDLQLERFAKVSCFDGLPWMKGTLALW